MQYYVILYHAIPCLVSLVDARGRFLIPSQWRFSVWWSNSCILDSDSISTAWTLNIYCWLSSKFSQKLYNWHIISMLVRKWISKANSQFIPFFLYLLQNLNQRQNAQTYLYCRLHTSKEIYWSKRICRRKIFLFFCNFLVLA